MFLKINCIAAAAAIKDNNNNLNIQLIKTKNICFMVSLLVVV
jgi:hypothetical protein